MKKNFKWYVISWLLLVAIFHAIIFLIPTNLEEGFTFDGAFFCGYLLVSLAFVGQLICAWVAFQAKNRERLFLNVPLIIESYSALILILFVGTICLAVPQIPYWIGSIVSLLILCFSILSIIKANVAANLVERTGHNVKEKTAFIKNLTLNMEQLLLAAKSDVIRNEVNKAYEAVRYSDPMSSDAVTKQEAKLTLQYENLSKVVGIEDVDTVKQVVMEMVATVKERNSICKLHK